MKYYTAFLSSTMKGGNHVTHKYLGEQSSEKVNEITALLDEFFLTSGPVTPTREVEFCMSTFFGPHHDIAVLLPHPKTSPDAFRPALREMLNKFAKDAWNDYRPHLTTQESRVLFRINFYALMHKGTIIKAWPLVYVN